RAATGSAGGEAGVRAAPRSARGARGRFLSRPDCRLEQVVGWVSEELGHLLEAHLVGDQPLPGVGAAREEGERRTNVPRGVVERAPQRQLLVVEPVRVDGELGSRLEAAEEDDRA